MFLRQCHGNQCSAAEREIDELIDLSLFLSVADLQPHSVQVRHTLPSCLEAYSTPPSLSLSLVPFHLQSLKQEHLSLDDLFSLSSGDLESVCERLGLGKEEEMKLKTYLALLTSCYSEICTQCVLLRSTRSRRLVHLIGGPVAVDTNTTGWLTGSPTGERKEVLSPPIVSCVTTSHRASLPTPPYTLAARAPLRGTLCPLIKESANCMHTYCLSAGHIFEILSQYRHSFLVPLPPQLYLL